MLFLSKKKKEKDVVDNPFHNLCTTIKQDLEEFPSNSRNSLSRYNIIQKKGKKKDWFLLKGYRAYISTK